jgi:biotin carboxyl carrier protein
MAQRLRIRAGDVEREITVDEGDVRFDDGAHGRVTVLAPGEYRVEQDGATMVVLVADGASGRWVFADGETWRMETVEGPARRTRAGVVHHDVVVAPMPATVLKVLVAPGDAVAHGDTLLLLEAMKMELPLRAPHGGVITAVNCAEGDLVQPETPLVEIEEVEKVSR